jgi:phenylpropionate dioxygenase-like ring-hydroxylating dioxygenase large terminal subunit
MSSSSMAANPVLRSYWHPVLRATDLGDEPVARTLLTQRIVLFRGADGQPVAAADRCPHREAPLSAGRVTDGCLQCAYHGWTFAADGRCVRVPSNVPNVPAPPKAHLRPMHCVERYGLVWVCPGEPAAGIPEVPHDDDPAYRRINVEVQEWHTSTLRMVDNFLDIAHFPWVHTGTFGSATEQVVPSFELMDMGDFHGYAYEVEVANTSDAARRSAGATAATLTRSMTSGFSLPFTCLSTIRYETGLDNILLLLSTPIDDVTSYFTFVSWRNDDFSVPAEEVIRFDRAVGEEDRKMLEQLDGPFPLERGALCDVRADRTGVEWRRRLVALLDGSDPQ